MPPRTLYSVILAATLLLPQRRALAQPHDPAAAMKDWPRPTLRTGLSDAQIASAIAVYAQQLHDAGHFSGVVLAAKAGQIVVAKPYGLADVAAGTPNTLDTRFNIGSITKLFTKLAIAQLAAAGRLSLDDTLGTHVPALPVPSADRITLRQLVEHRAGMADIFGPRFEASQPAQLRELSDFIPLFADQPLAFEPGTSEQYSNAGYVVLGLVIERVTGQRYRDYVAQHIFVPAGMTATGLEAVDEHIPAIATGYTHFGLHGEHAELLPNTDTLTGRPSSAGGALATAGDLLRFWQALRGNQLASPTWTRWVLGAPALSSQSPGPATGAAEPPARRPGQVTSAAEPPARRPEPVSGAVEPPARRPEPVSGRAAPAGQRPEPAGAAAALAGAPSKLMLGGGAPGVNAAVQLDGNWLVIVLANLDPPAAFAMARGAGEIIHGRREPEIQIRPGMHRVTPPPPAPPLQENAHTHAPLSDSSPREDAHTRARAADPGPSLVR